MKKFILLALPIILSKNVLAYTSTKSGPNWIFCPSTPQIIITDIYEGKANSQDGKWTGISAIPPQYQNNWQQKIDSINYNNGGYCQYFIGGTEAIDLRDNIFPSEYNLYDISLGTDPLSNYWEFNAATTPTQPTSDQPCYYYKNPVK